MKYLVTGAAGFIGSHLSEYLLARGDDVVAVDCLTTYYDRNAKLENARAAGITLVNRDLSTDPVKDLLDGVDGIFHLAGQPGVRQSWGDDLAPYLSHNLLATERLAAAANEARVRVVFSSSSSVYGSSKQYPTPEDAPTHPVSPYGVTKLACENLLAAHMDQHGLDAVILRYFTVYGPRQRPDMAFSRMLAALHSGNYFVLFGDGTATRSFTYVSDVVAATVAAMEQASPCSTYNVGGGSEASMNEVIEIVREIAGRELKVRRTDPSAGDVRRTAADISKIRSELGWEPKVMLHEGIAAQWKYTVAINANG